LIVNVNKPRLSRRGVVDTLLLALLGFAGGENETAGFFKEGGVEPICEFGLKDFASVAFAFAARVDPENGKMRSVDVTGLSESSEDLVAFVLEMSVLTRRRAVLQNGIRMPRKQLLLIVACTGCVLTGMRGILEACHC
jgi:hypothetical protein